MTSIHALLIGVDHYFPNNIGGSSYPSLGGCVRDVRHVQAYLTDRVKVPPENVTALTISDPPAEPEDHWPTYEKMVAAFKQLTERAQPGDQVYIHYSGHGGRAATAYAKLKGKDALDEALVPTDIGKPSSRYLRDVELGYLIKAMVKKKLLVTVVLDSCHSGGATRGKGRAVKRGASKPDLTPRPTDSLVASEADLLASWEGAAGGATRGSKPASGWLYEPQGYVLLAACRANEYATEFPFDGQENNGALTYWLLDTLRQAPEGCTYRMLHDRILAKVHSQFEEQTPQLQGDGERALWGGVALPSEYAVSLLAVESGGADKGRVRLNAGEVHGVGEGAQFAVYPNGAADRKEDQRLALVEVTEVGEVASWADIVEDYGRGEIDVDARAVLLNILEARLQRGVVVDIEDAALRQRVEAAIQQQGKGFVAVAQGSDPIDFQVVVNEGGEYELWDPAGAAIPNLRPALRADDPGALARLVGRLVHLAKYHNVRDLDLPNAAARAKLQVTLEAARPIAAPGGEAPIFKPKERVKLVIRNAQEPDPYDANNPDRVLNITVLALQSDWSIAQLYPARAGAFEALDPKGSIPVELETYLPEGYEESLDVLKVFATRDSTSFRWLELPALDQPDTRPRRTRGAIRDPLQQMLASLTGEQATTRSTRLVGAATVSGWTVGQVELRVKKGD